MKRRITEKRGERGSSFWGDWVRLVRADLGKSGRPRKRVERGLKETGVGGRGGAKGEIIKREA